MFERHAPKSADFWPAMFPTPTAGNGAVRFNNLRPGSRQPDANPSVLRKFPCKMCGMLNSLSRVAPSGGDENGDGAFSGNVLSGVSADGDLQGEGQLQVGAGCCFCGSKNCK